MYTAPQKHESTLLHTHVLDELLTADRLCTTKYFRVSVYIDSFHAMLALRCGLAKCQCYLTAVTVVVYYTQNLATRVMLLKKGFQTASFFELIEKRF